MGRLVQLATGTLAMHLALGSAFRSGDAPNAAFLLTEMIIGPQPGGANAGDSANVIHLVDVASHANSAHDFSLTVANELPSCFQKQRPISDPFQRLYE